MSGTGNWTRRWSHISVLTGPDIDNFVNRSQCANHCARPPGQVHCGLLSCGLEVLLDECCSLSVQLWCIQWCCRSCWSSETQWSVRRVKWLSSRRPAVTGSCVRSVRLRSAGSPNKLAGVQRSVLTRFLPRCMQCRRGLAMRILSVCPSVCLSVTRVYCDKTVERSAQIYIPYER